MSVFLSWLILIISVLMAIGIMRIIHTLKDIELFFTGDKRRKYSENLMKNVNAIHTIATVCVIFQVSALIWLALKIWE